MPSGKGGAPGARNASQISRPARYVALAPVHLLARLLEREDVRRAHVVLGVGLVPDRHRPVELADDRVDARPRALEVPVAPALVAARAALARDVGRVGRLDQRPVAARLDQPAEAVPRLVEQVLVPRVAHVLDRDAALHEADQAPLDAVQRALRAERQERLHRHGRERLQHREVPRRVEERPAVRAGHALRAVGRADLQRAAAVGTGERLRGGRLVALVLRGQVAQAHLVERDLAAHVERLRLLAAAVVECRQLLAGPGEVRVVQRRAGRDVEGQLAPGGHEAGAADLGHHERPRRSEVDRLPHAQVAGTPAPAAAPLAP